MYLPPATTNQRNKLKPRVQKLFLIFKPHASSLKRFPAALDAWRRFTVEQKGQRNAMMAISQSRNQAVHVLRKISSRDIISSSFHSWKLHASFRAKLRHVLQMHISQCGLANATRMKRAVLAALVASVHQARHTRAVVQGRARSHSKRTLGGSFDAWLALSRDYKRNRQKGLCITNKRSLKLTFVAFRDWLMSAQCARNSMLRDAIRSNMFTKVSCSKYQPYHPPPNARSFQ